MESCASRIASLVYTAPAYDDVAKPVHFVLRLLQCSLGLFAPSLAGLDAFGLVSGCLGVDGIELRENRQQFEILADAVPEEGASSVEVSRRGAYNLR